MPEARGAANVTLQGETFKIRLSDPQWGGRQLSVGCSKIAACAAGT